MGIEHFRAIFRQYKPFRSASIKKLPDEIMSLFIDCNGIFHNAKRGVFPSVLDEKEVARVKKKYTKSDLRKKYLTAITDKLDELIEEFHPTHNLIIAPDGVANAAKLNQQKTRRFKPDDETESVYGFDGRTLTPGTEIMFQIDKHIKKWIKNHPSLPPNIIYSSQIDPGEGEHKIFQFVRDGLLIGDTEEGNHVIFGADGDLYILSVLCELPNMFLHRDDNKPDPDYDIKKFREGILEVLGFDGCDERLIYQDFALLSTFVGNDFVSKMPNLPATYETLWEMFKVYGRIQLHLTDEEGDIIWENFSVFIKKVNRWKIKGEDSYLYSYDKLTFPVPEMIDYMTIKEKKSGRVIPWEEGDYDQSRHTREFDQRGFENVWYNKQFKPKDATYYRREGIKEYYTKKDLFNMSVDYLKIMQWFLHYYLKGYRYVSQQFFYPYHITPLLHNLNYYLKTILDRGNEHILSSGITSVSDKGKDYFVITPIHQLLSVLPHDSKKIIPAQFRPLYDSLKCVNPTEYYVLPPENTNADYHVVPIVPPINLPLVNYLIVESGVPIPEKYLPGKIEIYKKKGSKKK